MITSGAGCGPVGSLCAALVFILSLSAVPAWGQGVPEEFWGAPRIEPGAPDADYSIEDEQTYLLWVGFYYGKVDGVRNADTIEAIERFQASLGEPVTSRLTLSQRRILKARAERARDKADFQRVDDEWTGISVRLPMGYLSEPDINPDEDSNASVSYPARGSSDLSVRLIRIENVGGTPKQVFEYLIKLISEQENTQIVAHKIRGDFFRIASIEGSHFVNMVMRVSKNEARGVKVMYPVARINVFLPVQSIILSEMQPFDRRGLSASERRRRIQRGDYPGVAELPSWYRSMNGSGSGSVVSYSGHILTNFHVVEGCSRVTVNGNDALLIGVDIVNDLALLSSARFADRDPVRFRQRDTRLGEEVIVMGYPLFTAGTALNLTTGVVSARFGLHGDRRNIQVTAPVQPGNSGGPVFDRGGNQVAVVVTKASASMQIQRNAENMAWVIRGNIAQDFLRDHGVTPLVTNELPSADRSIADVAARARRYTVRVECHRT